MGRRGDLGSSERLAATCASNSLRDLKIFAPRLHPVAASRRNASRTQKMETRKQTVGRTAGKCGVKIFVSVTVLLAVASFLIFSIRSKTKSEPKETATTAPAFNDPLGLVLTPLAGNRRTDREISRLQQRIREGRNVEVWLEQLGWAFVAKARESFDAGFYKLAEQCAHSIKKRNPQSSDAMLLRAHALQNLHRFKESEALARHLVQQRGLAFDYGLLGDALMEQGKLNEAVEAYQQMIDLKPDLHAYARAAHMRWLKGDLVGAIAAMQLAVSAASPHDAESAAWVNTRLATYLFQAGKFEEAEQRCAFAISLQNDYPPALLLQAKMLLGQERFGEAVDALQTAVKLNPLPEYQWTLAEALRAAGRENEASAVEARVQQYGAVSDPRTLSLFLSTRHESPETALRLAQAEFGSRSDVFTYDILAWSLAAAGKLTEAHSEMQRALAEGTEDARLFFHAAIIASQTGRTADAERWLRRASDLSHLLLPSERNELCRAWGAKHKAAVVPNTTKNSSARTKCRAESSTPTTNQNLKHQ
jgi:tetratricopeptide (TPR) repeat protein